MKDLAQERIEKVVGPADKDYENSIRPRLMQDFAGQPHLIENLRIFIKAANLRGEALDHVLFHGPPGHGKTTLSRIIAQELGVRQQSVHAAKRGALIKLRKLFR